MNKIFTSLLFVIFAVSQLNANNCQEIKISAKLIQSATDTNLVQFVLVAADSLKQEIAPIKNKKEKGKFISSVLAFPFPFGFMGAHRVMLGTKPWVPIVYVATFGGCFGIIPLIDFCVIVFSKDIEQYKNNPNVFMWIK